MKRVNDNQILIRRTIQKEIGLIQLPDEFTIGKTGASSMYRFTECIDAKDIPVGAKVIVHEAGSQSLELIGDNIHRAPIDFVLAYIEDNKVKCLKNLILVKVDPQEETISGSFLLAPESSRLPSQTGTVLQVGPDTQEIKVGDRIMWSLFSGVEIDLLDEGTCVLLREFPLNSNYIDEVVGILEKN